MTQAIKVTRKAHMHNKALLAPVAFTISNWQVNNQPENKRKDDDNWNSNEIQLLIVSKALLTYAFVKKGC